MLRTSKGGYGTSHPRHRPWPSWPASFGPASRTSSTRTERNGSLTTYSYEKVTDCKNTPFLTIGPLSGSLSVSQKVSPGPVATDRPSKGDYDEEDESHHEKAEDDCKGRSHPADNTVTAICDPGSMEVLDRVRGSGRNRPLVDPQLVGGLRDWLEDGIAAAAAELSPDSPPVRVTKQSLAQVLICESHFVAERTSLREPSVETARGSLVDALFRQQVTIGRIGDPLAEATEALKVGGDNNGVVEFVRSLPDDQRVELEEEIAAHATRLAGQWPKLSPSWLARTQQRLSVALAGGRVLVSGAVDLALGHPAGDQTSVCLVEVKSGRRRPEHRLEVHLYALLEALRSGAPPFQGAIYYTGSGELDVEPVSEDILIATVRRTLDGAIRLCHIAAGGEPKRSPNPLCGWCAGLADCPPGQESVS